jgi:hypothetical protein
VNIIFSRHAKRRAKLYKISEDLIEKSIEKSELNEGIQEIINEIDGLSFPLKIVLSVEKNIITVITNYPLKKGK